MSPEQIALVQSNFSSVEPIADQAAQIFYTRLFEIAPEVKPMFKADIAEQGKKLMSILGVAVKGLNDIDSLLPALQNLGRGHASYGVKEEHFQPVAEALLWTLEQGLGDAWSEEAKDAWTAAYISLTIPMLEAMKELEPA
ncbi:globin family protein [Agaribacterium sp. ZY112]|uniref:globin family protein n=1 Tax=Agaribacterium sp. ZY112 TaxID=3233574 RepID=UPI003524D488